MNKASFATNGAPVLLMTIVIAVNTENAATMT
jgi:hypothetical protein